MRRARARAQSGFTAVELIVAMVVGLIVLTALYEGLVSQWRLYAAQRQASDVRETLRGAATLLHWELAASSASGGDLYAIGATSVRLRATQATGVVCALKKVGQQQRYGLHDVSGFFEATPDDSALVYLPASGSWHAVRVVKAWNREDAYRPSPPGAGVPSCAWGAGTLRPQAAVALDGASEVLNQIGVGSALRGFRATSLGLVAEDGRWWLARWVGGSTAHEILTGPLLSPEEGGMHLEYRDADGAPTSSPTAVHSVAMAVRAASVGRAPSRSGAPRAITDSLFIVAALRNNAVP